MKKLLKLLIILLISITTLTSCGDEMTVSEAYTIFTQKVVTSGDKFLGDKYAVTKTHSYSESVDSNNDTIPDTLYNYYIEETWVTKYGYHYKQTVEVVDIETKKVIEDVRTFKEVLIYLYEGYLEDDADGDGKDDGVFPDLGYYEFYDPDNMGAWSSKNSNGVRWTFRPFTLDEIISMRGDDSDIALLVKNIYLPLTEHAETITSTNVIQGETRTSEFAMIYKPDNSNSIYKFTASTVDVMSDIFKGKYYPKKLVIDHKDTGLTETYTWSAGVWKITDAVSDRFGNVYDNARSVGWVVVE